MKVKICGIRSYEDARSAIDAGAWALGFVFHPPSPRNITPEEAAGIVRRLPPGLLTVGVFVDHELRDLNAVVEGIGLRGVQLHGKEDSDYAKGVRAEVLIKAIRVTPGFDLDAVRGFPDQMILLDAYTQEAAGGTGKTFDWKVARQAGRIRPIILAGGITPLNVEEALEAACPDAIDVSSGVEGSPGRKDREKITRLFEAVERFESNQRSGAH